MTEGEAPETEIFHGEDEMPTVKGPATAATPPHLANLPAQEDLAELFPDLEILELLGAGGMGAVFKARQPGLDRFVAVKILSKSLAEDEQFIVRFQREAKAMAKLAHPNIVTIYDFGERGGFYYFVMEFIDGGDLHQLIQAKQLAPAAVLELIPQICDAIQFAHEEGVTHRDIKPANILLDRKGRVKIADFGLAKILQGTTDISLTLPGTAMGTPFYMAPEQMKDSENVDQRADIYSLGVVLYQMLTGNLPQGDFPPPSQAVPEVNSNIDNAVMRALAQDPNLRFSEVKEMLDALSMVREKRENGMASPKPRPKADQEKKGNPVGWIAAVLVAGILGFGAVIWKPWESLNESRTGIPARRDVVEETTGRNARPTIDLPPAIAAMKEHGGRLRSYPDGPVDYAEGIDDLVAVFGGGNAIRANKTWVGAGSGDWTRSLTNLVKYQGGNALLADGNLIRPGESAPLRNVRDFCTGDRMRLVLFDDGHIEARASALISRTSPIIT